jgi:hypothetical protein
MTIHIFGDSFACICENVTDKCCWPHRLSVLKKENVRGFGKAGSGPNDALTKLVFQLEEELIKPHDTVFVALSDQKRLNFSFLKNKNDSAYGIFQIAEDDYAGDAHFMKKVAGNTSQNFESILKLGNEIKIIAQSLGPMFLYENVKNISFLRLIANNFKNIRFIVFTCFSLDHYISYYKNFNITSTKLLNSLIFDSLDSSNFDYVKIPIGHIVGQASNSDIFLLNHMTSEQNMKFAQLVYDVIMYNKIDKSWFVKDVPYDDPDESFKKMEPLFIYE